ncbi:MAG: protein phosphatase CheZ [Rhodospirillales bacterium]|nr:protein phosphatase CheZ [Alphaproteobacteria bacterium]MCB9987146.1 protein phosphatase CheZ [Rhodospirillales bacterium]USO08097.1 MAG: protein phosphatase CheZ [Rhodospirillales bacterium]
MTSRQYDRNKVVSIVNSVIAKIGTAAGSEHDSIVRELEEMRAIIEAARREIAGVRPQDVAGKNVPDATDELDAVIADTKQATDTIMSACEAMEKAAAGKDDPVSQAVIAQVTTIYEACSFQDITGQRIRKVVKVLREIQDKVQHMLAAIGHSEGGADPASAAPAAADTRSGDEKLLNGPQLPGGAISQDEIDKLLASFD